jgi:hypothetical protein
MQRSIDRVLATYADNLPRGRSWPGPRSTWTSRKGRVVGSSEVRQGRGRRHRDAEASRAHANARCLRARARSATTVRRIPCRSRTCSPDSARDAQWISRKVYCCPFRNLVPGAWGRNLRWGSEGVERHGRQVPGADRRVQISRGRLSGGASIEGTRRRVVSPRRWTPSSRWACAAAAATSGLSPRSSSRCMRSPTSCSDRRYSHSVTLPRR